MNSLQPFLDTLEFRWTTLTWSQLFDLALVTLSIYVLLSLVRNTGAAILLRGALIVSSVLFMVTIILPLPAFDWLVRGVLLAMFIATPIIFQPELRRLFERIGRTVGVARDVRQTTIEHTLPSVVRAVETMAGTHTGALIAVEGETSLQEFIETGVPIGGQVTSELLQAIFYPSNPLHDGAVILREDKVVAAGCVLPLTQKTLPFQRRLGTRHRAAVGLSEATDALVIVVSEETGHISVARRGTLERPLDAATLRQHMFDFYTPQTVSNGKISLWSLTQSSLLSVREQMMWPSVRELTKSGGMVMLSLVLAVASWAFVLQQELPTEQVRFDNIPLQVVDIPPGTTLVTNPPNTVSAIVETLADVRSTLSSRSFQATASLDGVEPGLQHLPIQVESAAQRVRVVQVEPAAIDVEVARIISRTMDVSVELRDQQSLPRAYQVNGNPAVLPTSVTLTGAEPLINQVVQLRVVVSLANASASIYELRPVRAFDSDGREITGLTIEPAQVNVAVPVRRRIDARDVGIRVVTEGSPASGYWLSGLEVSPTTVTLQGNPDQLLDVGSYIDTLPIDISDAAGDVSVQATLDLPPDVQAVTSEGNTTFAVSAVVRVTPRRGNLAVVRPVELSNMIISGTVSIVPAQANLVLSGPLPTLREIEATPSLVQVVVDGAHIQPGRTASLTATVVTPDNIMAQMVPPTVAVTHHEDDVSSDADGR